jgi:hypothetical protein
VKKVAWGDAEAEPPSDEAAPAVEEKAAKPKKPEKKAEPEDEEVSTGGNVIDLDALPAKAAPKPAPRAEPEPAPVAAAEEEAEAEEEPAAKAEPEPEPPSNDPLAVELRKRRAQASARSEARKEKSPAKKKKAKRAADDETAAAASYKGSDPCRAAKFSVARVREACASGGRAAAKRVMKDAIGKATATGQTLKCSNCHSNQRDYALKADAVAELKRWLESSSS